KAAVVLLHELGHTLGALHERDRTNIMNPRYSTSVRRFSPEALDVMRAVLAHRTASGDLDAPGKRTLVGLLRREPSPWVPEERASELARFDVHTPEAAPAARAPAPSALAPEDQSAFEEASRRLAAGDPEGALRVGKPLFDAYPDVAQVSELRCKIALGRGLAWEVTRTECASLTQGAFGTH
ncbi:MAG TPA: matrixin family metalloprotease, partial [Polyangiaceae bacterium]|nr:matrixin family metalloprotease [Polyangiaceae bacterium]